MLQAGAVIHEKYTIERVLGQGGMGAVYLARMDGLGGKTVAVKEMVVAIADAEQRAASIRQFQREAHMLARLDHPGLVDVSDYFEEDGNQYLVMAYVDGTSLDAVLANEPGFLSVPQVVRWADEICEVLTHLHSQQPPVIFRDLKPSNVMLDRRGSVRLVDFGIARVFDSSPTTAFIRGAGTPGFAPLEQFGGGFTDARSDVYALGATLYSLLTRTVPPVSVDLVSGNDVLLPPDAINPAVPPAVSAVVLRMMGLFKEDRYPTVAEAQRALLAAVLQNGTSLEATALPPRAREPGPARTSPSGFGWAIAATVAVLIASGAGRQESALDRAPAVAAATPHRAPSASLDTAARAVSPRGLLADLGSGLVAADSSEKVVGEPSSAGAARKAAATGTLQVSSVPSGAAMWLDGKALGTTPQSLSRITPGRHEVVIRREGFEPYATRISVHPDTTAELMVPLKKIVRPVVYVVPTPTMAIASSPSPQAAPVPAAETPAETKAETEPMSTDTGFPETPPGLSPPPPPPMDTPPAPPPGFGHPGR